MLPWLAMSLAGGRLHLPPPQHMRTFGGGSGLLAFAVSPAAHRCSFGPPETLEEEVGSSTAAAPPASESPLSAATAAAQSAWSVLFPRNDDAAGDL